VGSVGAASRATEEESDEFAGKPGGGNATAGGAGAPAPPAPANDSPDLPPDSPPPDDLTGFWTSDETGDSFLLTVDGGALRAYRGQPWACRPSGPGPVTGAVDGYPSTDEYLHVQRHGDDLSGEIEVCWFGGGAEPYWIGAPLTLSLSADRDALVGSWHDDLANREVELHLTRQPVPELGADEFGLPAINLRAYDYGPKVVHQTTGLIAVVPEGYVLDPETDESLVRHMGIDFTSRDDRWVVASLPFSTPVGGTVYVYPTSPWNTIAVLLDTGEQLQFLHADDVQVQSGARVDAGTILGRTGATGATTIHLHVQAKNAQGDFISPDWAIARARSAVGTSRVAPSGAT
jgi:Peptidase family M23